MNLCVLLTEGLSMSLHGIVSFARICWHKLESRIFVSGKQRDLAILLPYI